MDGPTYQSAMRLVSDAVETEQEGLQGTFYIDARGLDKAEIGTYGWYDAHLRRLYRLVRERGKMAVVLENTPRLFGKADVDKTPGSKAALYCGWYSLGQYVDAFEWAKGAVGYHVASSEARSLRDSTLPLWCREMINRGVAATLGSVQEPYISAFPLPDRFFPLLMEGKTPLIMVYYRTVPHLSWRQVLIGDPLYNPFQRRPAIRFPPTEAIRLPPAEAIRFPPTEAIRVPPKEE